MISLTPAKPAEASMLAALDAAAGSHPWPETALVRALARQQVVKLMEQHQCRGFLVAESVIDETTLLHLAVDFQYQGKGVARKGLGIWLAQLAAQGQRRCLLEVRVSNARAQALYWRLGFFEVGRRKAYYQNARGREDALVLERLLQA